MRFLPGLTSDSPVGGKINLRLILMSLITFTADLNNINACNCCLLLFLLLCATCLAQRGKAGGKVGHDWHNIIRSVARAAREDTNVHTCLSFMCTCVCVRVCVWVCVYVCVCAQQIDAAFGLSLVCLGLA